MSEQPKYSFSYGGFEIKYEYVALELKSHLLIFSLISYDWFQVDPPLQ